MMKYLRMSGLLLLLSILSVVLYFNGSSVRGQTSSSGFNPFEPATLLTVDVRPTVSFASSISQFTYTYDLTNSAQSHQSLDLFDLTIGSGNGIINPLNASNRPSWKGGAITYPDLKTDDMLWLAASGSTQTLNDIYQPDPDEVAPGDAARGIGAVARNLPGIRLAWYKGWVQPLHTQSTVAYVNSKLGTSYRVPAEIPTSTLAKLIPQVLPDHLNSVNIQTVGPDVLPDNFTNDQLLSRIINLKEQAFTLGWIDNQGVATSLDQKLAAAQTKLQAGDLNTVGNILHAVIYDLQAQHGQHVNDNAYYLLEPNIEFILNRIGQL